VAEGRVSRCPKEDYISAQKRTVSAGAQKRTSILRWPRAVSAECPNKDTVFKREWKCTNDCKSLVLH
jgi:hypothetical protein